MLVGTDDWVRMVFMWEETGVPGENPPVWLGDHLTISHADVGYRTRVAAVRGVCVNTMPTNTRQRYCRLQSCTVSIWLTRKFTWVNLIRALISFCLPKLSWSTSLLEPFWQVLFAYFKYLMWRILPGLSVTVLTKPIDDVTRVQTSCLLWHVISEETLSSIVCLIRVSHL